MDYQLVLIYASLNQNNANRNQLVSLTSTSLYFLSSCPSQLFAVSCFLELLTRKLRQSRRILQVRDRLALECCLWMQLELECGV